MEEWPISALYDADALFIIIRKGNSEEYCAMYDICGERSDGKVLNCPYGSPSVTVHYFWLVALMWISLLLSFFLSPTMLHFDGICNIFCFLAWWAIFCQNSKFVSNNKWECLLHGASVWNITRTSSTSKASFNTYLYRIQLLRSLLWFYHSY